MVTFRASFISLFIIFALAACSDEFNTPRNFGGTWASSGVTFLDTETCQEKLFHLQLDIEHERGATGLNGTSKLTNLFTGETSQGNLNATMPDAYGEFSGTLEHSFKEGRASLNLRSFQSSPYGALTLEIDAPNVEFCKDSFVSQSHENTLFRAKAGATAPVMASTAKLLEDGESLERVQIEGGDFHWYKLESEQDQLLNLSLQTTAYSLVAQLFDTEGVRGYFSSDDISFNRGLYKWLPAGSYYLAIYSENSEKANYSLNVKRPALPDERFEPNNTIETATVLDLSQASINAYLTPEDKDWFKFSVDKLSIFSNKVTFPLQDNDWESDLRVYYLDRGNLVRVSSEFIESNKLHVVLEPDTTYYMVSSRGGEHADNLDEPCKDYYCQEERGRLFDAPYNAYTLELNPEDVPEDDLEPNDTKENATVLGNDVDITGYIQKGDEDWFSFSVKENLEPVLGVASGVSSQKGAVEIAVYDDGGNLYGELIGIESGLDFAPLAPGNYDMRITSLGWANYCFTVDSEETAFETLERQCFDIY